MECSSGIFKYEEVIKLSVEDDMTPKEEWLKEYAKPKVKQKYSETFDRFCEWANTSDVELVNEYKTSDPREFAKKWGKKIVQYYKHAVAKGYKTNYARSLITAPRAFFSSECVAVKIKRRAIAPARMATNEHEFLIQELQKLYQVGDIQDKARLATGISLGWGAQDFVRLEWTFVEPYLAEDLEPPVAFWYEREKTGAPFRCHLTHEAIEALRELRRLRPQDKYVFTGQNGSHLTGDALNAWLKTLTRKAKITVRGRVRFHLLRKFLFSQLSGSGMNQFECRLCVGKSIPVDVLTYLKNQSEDLRQKYVNAEPRFSLTGYTNANHTKIEQLTEELKELRQAMKTIAKYVKAEMERNGAFATLLPSERETLNRLTLMGREEE